MLLLLLLLCLHHTLAQTCSVGGSSASCTLCPSGKGTVSGANYGADVGLSCVAATTPTGIRMGTSSPNCPITIGGAGNAVDIAPTTSGSVNIAAGASTGFINIGRTIGPTPAAPTSGMNIGYYASYIDLGASANQVYIQTQQMASVSQSITIGWNAARSSPTSFQTLYVGEHSTSIRLGVQSPTVLVGGSATALTMAPATTQAVNIGTGASTGAISIGRNFGPTPSWPAATLTLGDRSSAVYLGGNSYETYIQHSKITGVTVKLYVGWNTPLPTPDPTTIQAVYLGKGSRYVLMGQTDGPTEVTQDTVMGRFSSYIEIGRHYSGSISPTQSILIGAESGTITIGGISSPATSTDLRINGARWQNYGAWKNKANPYSLTSSQTKWQTLVFLNAAPSTLSPNANAYPSPTPTQITLTPCPAMTPTPDPYWVNNHVATGVGDCFQIKENGVYQVLFNAEYSGCTSYYTLFGLWDNWPAVTGFQDGFVYAGASYAPSTSASAHISISATMQMTTTNNYFNVMVKCITPSPSPAVVSQGYASMTIKQVGA